MDDKKAVVISLLLILLVLVYGRLEAGTTEQGGWRRMVISGHNGREMARQVVRAISRAKSYTENFISIKVTY